VNQPGKLTISVGLSATASNDPSQWYQTSLDLRNQLGELQQDLSSGGLQAPVLRPAR
jgi:hypothetical protein